MIEDFERDLFFLMHDVARLIRVEADKRARVDGMTRAQWSVLLRVNKKPGMTQKEIADILEVEPISVARLVDRLEANGLIERRADEQDRRIWRLHLLPAAIPKLAKINSVRDKMGDLISEGISDATREVMVEGLMRMKANLLQAPAIHVSPVGAQVFNNENFEREAASRMALQSKESA